MKVVGDSFLIDYLTGSALFELLTKIRDVGSDTEVQATFSVPPLSSSLSFSFFYSLSLLNPLTTSSTPAIPSSSSSKRFSSSSHITFLSSHLPSAAPSHSSLHLFCWKTPHLSAPLSYPVILSSCSPSLSIPPFSPSCPFCNSSCFFALLLPSSSESHSHLVCWNTLVSPLPGQGSTTAHFTHDRVCCMPVMYVCC